MLRTFARIGAGRIGSRRMVVGQRFASQWRNENKTDDKIEFKWFLLVGVFGTMVYVTVMQRIKEQDHSKNVEKYKKTFTEDEWQKYVQETQVKRLTLEHGEECFLVPFTHQNRSDSKIIKQTVEKLGGAENVGVLDLNELVQKQLTDESTYAKYHILLSQSLESQDDNSDGFKYKFTYKLKPGLFTQMVHDEILNQKKENGDLGRFLILNYPPTIKEAVKFEQNICNKDTLLTLQDSDSEIVQYFETVDKVISVKFLVKHEPLKVTSVVKQPEAQPSKFTLHVLSNTEPLENATAIEKAQYQLRKLGEPIRVYGESDIDVINRLQSLK